MMKNLELGSFIIRLVLGIIFLVHGFTKFQVASNIRQAFLVA